MYKLNQMKNIFCTLHLAFKNYQILILALYITMGYLILNDYKKLIQSENLSQIVGNDFSMINQWEQSAISEVSSYLVQKYDVQKEFQNITINNINLPTAKVGDRIYNDADAFDISKNYNANDKVLQGGIIFYAINNINAGTFNPIQWLNGGNQYEIFTLQNNNLNYTTTQGSIINTNWIAGDSRNQQILNCVIDIILYHLHSRIAPRNIPELRVKRYDDAIRWLKDCAKGNFITCSLPLLTPLQGNRNRYGSNLPKQNNNF